jgi:putative transposase
LSDLEKREILNVANSSEFRDKPPSQIVPLLADQNKYIASESSFYRVLKEHGQMSHRGKAKAASRTKPKELIATGPNQVYSWDITYLKADVRGMFFYLYFFMDIYSRKIVGFDIHETQDSIHSSRLIEEICRAEKIKKEQVTLHSDNGGPMKGATMLATLQKLGITPTFSRPSVSDDNPYSEALFKTTKYCPQFPSKPFASIDEARAWVVTFVHWYNEEHLHSGIKFVTPGARHRGEDLEILTNRSTVYEEAKSKHPNRWSGKVRNWKHIGKVFLNRLQRKEVSSKKIAA